MASKSGSAVSRRRTATPPATMFQKSDETEEIQPVEEPVGPKEKKTFHLDPDTVILLGKLQFDQWQATGKKPNLSDLVGEGIRLLAQSRTGSETQATG